MQLLNLINLKKIKKYNKMSQAMLSKSKSTDIAFHLKNLVTSRKVLKDLYNDGDTP